MVLVYSDDIKLTLELLHKAHDLAKELGKKVIAVVIDSEEHATQTLEHGADRVILVQNAPQQFKAEEYTQILLSILKDHKNEIVLIGSNKNGKELAGRLAATLNTGCVMDCTNLYMKDSKLTAERVVYSGNAIAVEQFTISPQIVTIPAKVFDPLPRNAHHTGEILKKTIDSEPSPSKILKIQEMKSEGINVEDAQIIVSCGRGFKKKEDIRLVSELADVLKGRTVGCSRPIAADLKWLSEDHWIGLSGHKVKPKLYVACGISGQIQHIAGMRDSGVIVAINKDPEALIFKSADYGIVGDLYEVLPKLTSAIKEKIG
ncbi:MAG: electron transfer flavoprotein subunit alpha/FixB family protein [Candidatus Thermoplasmatota archaeon]|nr:electron transfer flavoprotein subunit alpha/FixB family protein [Candidatus Thermoplasmatota archaeon]